jgi:hypothetical protein
MKFKENIFSEINLKLQKSKHSKVIVFVKLVYRYEEPLGFPERNASSDIFFSSINILNILTTVI